MNASILTPDEHAELFEAIAHQMPTLDDLAKKRIHLILAEPKTQLLSTLAIAFTLGYQLGKWGKDEAQKEKP